MLLTACGQQGAEPWTPEQLMAPAALAEMIENDSPETPVIISIGPAGGIPGSIEVGQTRDAANLEKLRAELGKLPKDAEVLLYCGCCPFAPCPNIRPAMRLMNELGHTSGHLLNLEQNLKADWIDKGYPVE